MGPLSVLTKWGESLYNGVGSLDPAEPVRTGMSTLTPRGRERGRENVPRPVFSAESPLGAGRGKDAREPETEEKKEGGGPAFELGWHHGDTFVPYSGSAGGKKVFCFVKFA